MSGPVYEALRAQREVTDQFSEYVFCNRSGYPLCNHNVTNRVWYPLLRYLGLKKRRAYQTRHTAATLWLAAGENPEWIARQMGHTTTELLFRVYSRYVPNLTRQGGSAIERLLAAHGMVEKEDELGTPFSIFVHSMPGSLQRALTLCRSVGAPLQQWLRKGNNLIPNIFLFIGFNIEVQF